MLFSILRDSREEEGRGFLADKVRNSKADQVAMTHSEGLSNSGEEDQRSVREGCLEEVRLEGKVGGAGVVKRWR